MTTFDKWVRERRKALGLNQAFVAQAVGVSQAKVSQWETGKAVPSDDEEKLLSVVLGKPVGQQGSGREAALYAPTEERVQVATPVKARIPHISQGDAVEGGESTSTKARGRKTKGASPRKGNAKGGDLGFESTLWQAADKLHNNMDAAEYKHVVLGLIFLKYISDAFEERHLQLVEEVKDGADPEKPDKYRPFNVFWGRCKLPGWQTYRRIRDLLTPEFGISAAANNGLGYRGA